MKLFQVYYGKVAICKRVADSKFHAIEMAKTSHPQLICIGKWSTKQLSI